MESTGGKWEWKSEAILDSPSELQPGFKLPTGPAKPAGSGTGIPDRFGRKPVQTGRSQIWI